MTGNVVLLGVSLAMRDWSQALRHATPIGAFVIGVAAAQIARLPSLHGVVRNIAVAALIAETVFLFAAGCLPAMFPNFPLILGISFVAAFQSSTFTHVEEWSYNSTMTTANFRYFAADATTIVLRQNDPTTVRRMRAFGTIALSFAIGAILGGLSVSRMANHALWLADVALLLAFIPLTRNRKGKCQKLSPNF